jgi:hypothetical protein
MQMLYNSDHYVVVQFELTGSTSTAQGQPAVAPRGGYEIVDKFARKEIFIEGDLAQKFREGVDALIESGPSEDEMDDYIARYSSLMQQPVVLH